MEELTKALAELSEEDKAAVLEVLGAKATETDTEPDNTEADVKAEVKEAVAAALAEVEKQRKEQEAEEAKAALEAERENAAKTRKVDPEEEAAVEAPAVHYAGIRSHTARSLRDLLAVKKADLEKGGLPAGKQFIEDFQRWNDDMLLLSRALHQNGHYPDVTKFAPYREFWYSDAVQKELKEKALYSTGSGVGDEWVPTEFSQQWMEQVGTQGEVMPTFRTLDMVTNPQTFPVFGNRTATMYLQGEATSDNPEKFRATDVTTAQLSLTAKQMALRIKWSQEFAEDAISGSLDYMRQDLSNSAAHGVDEAIIHGDASGNGFDTGYSYESDDRRKAFDGLRYYVHVTDTTARVDCSGVTWSNANNFLTVLATMNKYAGDNPVFLVDKVTAAKLGLLQDSNGNLVASPTGVVDSAARGAAKLTSLLGMRVIASEAMLTTLNASGVYDGSTTDYCAPLIYNPDAFYIGRRRGWTLEVEKDIVTGTWDLVMTVRLAFGTPYTSGEIVGEAYGVLTSW